ncbi:efflux RND transporter permease subunit [Saccharospirillum impatiens]|uniref:efflux RND transporter permease subunit n=1 Tax=Saccharospirillum impatiens TaxID=169438 RepID=UPI000427E438|nr:efflux RND transporter permease subunit [Saccharospirillum impatiens]
MKTLDNHGLLAYFSQHRVAANLIMIVVVLFGLMALSRLPTQLMPDFSLPGIEVSTAWPEANAQAVETYLTTPLEQAFRQLDDVEEVWSWSNQGHSQITVRYSMDANMDTALSDMAGLLSAFNDLPAGAETPEYQQVEEKEVVFSLLVTSAGPLSDLRPLVHDFKTDLMTRGIADVDVRGFPDQEIAIDVPLERLLASGQSLSDIANQVRSANRDDSAGQVGDDFSRASVVSQRRSDSSIALADLPMANQQPLSTLADVDRRVAPGARHYVLQGQSVARMLIFRSDNLDSLDTSALVYQWIDEVRPELPSGTDIVVWWDMSEFVQGNMDMLLQNSLMGLVLVVVILFIFLNRRVAWWTAMGIPVSVLGTLILLYLTGGSMNFLSMFAFLMALGIIVDDAIVVGEETVTQMEKGLSPDEATRVAARRMFGPVLASSLTTIAAFFPLLLVPGPFGELLRPIPVVIISVIVASLIECFLILPGHLNHSFHGHNPKRSRFRQTMDARIHRLREHYYRPFVTWGIRNRAITLSLAIGLFIVACGLPISGLVPITDMNAIEDNMVTAYIEFYDGTDEQVIDRYTALAKTALVDTDTALGNGQPIVDQVYEIYSGDEGFTQVQARLVDRDDRPVSNGDFLKAWGERIEIGPEVSYLSTDSEDSGDQSTLTFFLAGRDLSDLKSGAEALKARLDDYAGLSNVRDTLPWGDEQRLFELNATGLGLGLSETEIAAQIRQAFMGIEAQSFTEDGHTIPVMVRLAKADREAPGALYDLPIRTGSGQYVRLADVVDFRTERELSSIFHKDGQLGVEVKADVLGEDANMSTIAEDIRRQEMQPILDRYGLTAQIQGSAQDIQEMQQNLILAAMGGFVLIYFILVWMFGSYSWPLAVMSAIPLGLTGAIFGHWLLGYELTFLSFFGLFGLGGIIINDAIILINRYQEIRAEQPELDPRAAIVDASCQRFRAVMLTSITTVAGLVPILLATSVQAQLVQSMATSLAFGLAYGTLLVLVVIPAILTFIESANDRRQQFGRWVKRRVVE